MGYNGGVAHSCLSFADPTDRVLDVDGVSLAEVQQTRADRRELDECLESICLAEAAIVCKEPPSVERYEEELGVRQGTILAFSELDVDFCSC
jgi:hypothetical protein